MIAFFGGVIVMEIVVSPVPLNYRNNPVTLYYAD